MLIASLSMLGDLHYFMLCLSCTNPFGTLITTKISSGDKVRNHLFYPALEV